MMVAGCWHDCAATPAECWFRLRGARKLAVHCSVTRWMVPGVAWWKVVLRNGLERARRGIIACGVFYGCAG
jgi:hypothetical protein